MQVNHPSKTEYIGENAHRRGQARKFILDLVQKQPQGTHLTAAEIYDRLREAGWELSLSNVYRTLGMLKADGSLSSVAGEHGIRYEAHDSNHDHDHLICLSCGLAIEFVDELIQGFGQVLAKKSGYEFKRSRFDLFGLCSDCQSKSEEHQTKQLIASLNEVAQRRLKMDDLIKSSLHHYGSRKMDRGHHEHVEDALDKYLAKQKNNL